MPTRLLGRARRLKWRSACAGRRTRKHDQIAGYRRLCALEPGEWFRSVAPARYLKLYNEILNQLDPAAIFDRLIAFGANPVMLCWETASDCRSGKTFCHRHLVAQWLEQRLSIQVREVDHPNLDRFTYLRTLGIAAPDYRETSPAPAHSFR